MLYLYHSRSRISLLHKSKVKLRASVNNKDILDITGHLRLQQSFELNVSHITINFMLALTPYCTITNLSKILLCMALLGNNP